MVIEHPKNQIMNTGSWFETTGFTLLFTLRVGNVSENCLDGAMNLLKALAVNKTITSFHSQLSPNKHPPLYSLKDVPYITNRHWALGTNNS